MVSALVGKNVAHFIHQYIPLSRGEINHPRRKLETGNAAFFKQSLRCLSHLTERPKIDLGESIRVMGISRQLCNPRHDLGRSKFLSLLLAVRKCHHDLNRHSVGYKI